MSRQTVHVFSYPKSGGTWLSRLLGDTLNSPVGGITPEEDDKCIATEGQSRPGDYYIRHGHAVPVETGEVLIPDRFSFAYEYLRDEKVIMLFRDPRDVAVSAATYWGMDLTKTLHCMGHGEWPLTHGGGWARWMSSWFAAWHKLATGKILISYKRLSQHPDRQLEAIFYILNMPEPRGIDDSVLRQSITARRAYTEQHGDSLNYGKDAQLRFLRKGIVGDWKNHFTLEHKQLAEQYFGETMRELGYTDNEEWINEWQYTMQARI